MRILISLTGHRLILTASVNGKNYNVLGGIATYFSLDLSLTLVNYYAAHVLRKKKKLLPRDL